MAKVYGLDEVTKLRVLADALMRESIEIKKMAQHAQSLNPKIVTTYSEHRFSSSTANDPDEIPRCF